MKIALALTAIVAAFVAGLALEEKLEWRACRALAMFENPAPPAWAKVHRPAEPLRPVELARR
jgi:hypothetical protein